MTANWPLGHNLAITIIMILFEMTPSNGSCMLIRETSNKMPSTALNHRDLCQFKHIFIKLISRNDHCLTTIPRCTNFIIYQIVRYKHLYDAMYVKKWQIWIQGHRWVICLIFNCKSHFYDFSGAITPHSPQCKTTKPVFQISKSIICHTNLFENP